MKAKPYTTAQSGIFIDRGVTLGAKGKYTLGEAVINGDRAEVIMSDPDGTIKDFATVLFKEEGAWKVDLPQTMEGLIGKDAEKLKMLLR